MYFQKRGGCTVDFIVEDSDILDPNKTSHPVEFTMRFFNHKSLNNCLDCFDSKLENKNM